MYLSFMNGKKKRKGYQIDLVFENVAKYVYFTIDESY